MSFAIAEGFVEISSKGFGPVSTAIDGVTSKLKTMAATPMHSLEGGLSSVTSHITSMLSPMALVTEALAGLGAGVGVAGMLSMAAGLEKTKIGFDQLTRSAETTDALLGTLKRQFVGSGISGEQYKAAAKEMLALGVSAEEIPSKLKALGNISAATGEPLEAMASAMRRVEITGRVTSRTIMMMGPSIQNMLSRMYPALGENLAMAAENGQIGIEHLQAAIQNLGGETGMYANALAANQASMSGQWDILQNNVAMAATKIGDWIIRAFDLKEVTGNLSTWVDWFIDSYGDTILDTFYSIRDKALEAWAFICENKSVIVALGEVVAAVVGVTLAFSAASVVLGIVAPIIEGITAVSGLCAMAMTALGIAVQLVCSPITLTILALAALAGAVYGVLRYFGMTDPIDDFASHVVQSVKNAVGAVMGMVPGLGDVGIKTAALNEEMAKLDAARDAREKKRGGMGSAAKLTDKERAERNKWVPTTPAMKTPALGVSTVIQRIEFVGLSQLAEKMQTEASKSDVANRQLAVAQQQQVHLQKLADCVEGDGLKISRIPAATEQKTWGA
jgi:hypothetical protein